jgi:hypothetical protein
MYQYITNKTAEWNNNFVEPIRDTVYRTPSRKICELEKYSLFRHNRPNLGTNSEATHMLFVSHL